MFLVSQSGAEIEQCVDVPVFGTGDASPCAPALVSG